MAKPKTFDSYAGVLEYFIKDPECARLGKYMHIYRVNRSDDPIIPISKDEHTFMAVNMLTGRPINMPQASVPKNKCLEPDEAEINLVEYFYFNDGDPEDDGYDDVNMPEAESPKPQRIIEVIN